MLSDLDASRGRIVCAADDPRVRMPAALTSAIAMSLVACGVAYAASPDGAELANQGSPGVPACASCHGQAGEGQPAAGIPRLAGQDRAYLAKQLADFSAGRRQDPVMAPIAKALDEASREAASAYYATLTAPAVKTISPASPIASATTASPAPRNDGGVGAKLARAGDWDHDIPACFACHGPGGVGVGAVFPRIAGQLASYTERQLRDWKSGARANDPQGLMKTVAQRLSDAQIQAVADYLQGLDPSAVGK